MKIFAVGLIALALAGQNAEAQQSGGEQPTIKKVSYHTGYLPNGFDTNDHIQIVGEGVFSNSCYKPAGTDIKVDQEAMTVTISPSAYHYNGMCLQVLVPYSQVLDLGIMKAGVYTVLQEKRQIGELKVKVAANAAPDDFLYAPISQAYLKSKHGDAKVALNGEFTNSCMKMSQILTDVQDKVIVVQPIAEIEDREDCVDGKFPFEKTLTVSNVKPGRYLLHVRSLNGKAVNNLVDIR